MSKRAKDYKALSEKEINFLSSAGNYRRAGKILTNKQVKWVKDILSRLADAEVIKHNGIDSDQAMGELTYVSHDPVAERPVRIKWQITDFDSEKARQALPDLQLCEPMPGS